tara:strand:+ start:37 stop:630 length:594 start_codon:yes stop_codon:yes gene_type:complete
MENNPTKMNADLLFWNDDNALDNASKVISSGGIIVYPTDTVYGFGVDATNENSIKRLNNLKNRKGPISVIAPGKNVVSKWIDIPNDQLSEAISYLEPYTTIIYPVKKGIVNELILGPNSTLGIRIPNHPFCLEIAKKCNTPITTTSVNRTGQKPQSNVDNILKHFGNDVDLIIDDGDLTGPASSIFLYEKSGLKNLR